MLPFFGKMRRRRLPRPRWVNPRPHQEKTPWSRRQRPLRPAVPALRAAVVARSARGRPGPRVAPVPEAPLCLPGLPHQGRAPDPVAGDEPLPGADAKPVEKSPPAPGGRVTFEPLLPTSRRKPRAASRRSVTSKEGTRPAAGRRYRAAEGPHVYAPTSDEKPPPRGRAPTRAPLQPSAFSPRRPAAIKPRDPDSGSHLRRRGRARPAAPPGARHGPRTPEPLGAHSPPTRSANRRG